MTIARFHRAVFGSNISSPQLTNKRLDRIGINLTKDTALTPALVNKARAAYERYKQKNPRYVQRLESAASARAARQGRIAKQATASKAVPIPDGAREVALPLHVIPERSTSVRQFERKPRTADAETQDRQIAVLLLQAAVALLNR
jgi:hypothetical protein